MNLNCMLCDADLRALGSREHIVPQSIGGRRRTKWSLCNRCNNETGRNWDAELADSLLPFQQLVHEPGDDIRARRVKDPQTGRTFILKAGLRGAQAEPEVRRSTDGNQVTFETSAMTAAQAGHALERALREEGFSRQAAKKEASRAVTERQLRKQFVEMNVVTSFGDGSVYSSIKSAVNAGVEAGLTGDEMERARRCLRGGHSGNHVMWIPAKPGIVQPRDLDRGQWCHTVGIRTDSEEKVVWGLCEWYGVVRLLMMLGTRYQGEVREWWYGVDGRTGQEVPVLIAEDKWWESVERARGLDCTVPEMEGVRLQKLRHLLTHREWCAQALMDWRRERSPETAQGRATVEEAHGSKEEVGTSKIHVIKPSQEWRPGKGSGGRK